MKKVKTINKAMEFREWLLILILSVIWGGSFFFVGVAVKELPPLTVVLGRVTVASLFLLAVVCLKGERMPTSIRIWCSFLVMGALNNVVPFCLIVWGQTRIESSLASILNSTTPMFSIILAHFITREEKLTINRINGIIIGWIGVSILLGFESVKGFNLEVIGQIAVIGAAVSYAFAAIYGRRFKQMNPIVVATGMLMSSAIMMVPFTLFLDQPWTLSPGAATIASVLSLAIISTSFAYIIYFTILATAGATNLLLVTLLIPVSATFLGVIFLGDRPGWEDLAGMGMICAGLIVIDGRVFPKIRKKFVW